MRILSWNLNHRAARRTIPPWISQAIAAQAPDVVALNEYVDARDQVRCRADHQRFLDDLSAIGLTHHAMTARIGRSNQVLVAAREPIDSGTLVPAKDIHDSLPPNFLHVRLAESGTELIAFRMPAYEYRNRHKKRLTWDWLIDALGAVQQRPAVLIGDLNTAPDDSDKYCGNSLAQLALTGWKIAIPSDGYSWRRCEGSPERRIDLAFTPRASAVTASRTPGTFTRSTSSRRADTSASPTTPYSCWTSTTFDVSSGLSLPRPWTAAGGVLAQVVTASRSTLRMQHDVTSMNDATNRCATSPAAARSKSPAPISRRSRSNRGGRRCVSSLARFAP